VETKAFILAKMIQYFLTKFHSSNNNDNFLAQSQLAQQTATRINFDTILLNVWHFF